MNTTDSIIAVFPDHGGADAASKNIAADLCISQRTVENHRASIMANTGSKSLPALARLALAGAEDIGTDHNE